MSFSLKYIKIIINVVLFFLPFQGIIAQNSSEYGGIFTPRGELKTLIVFVTFSNNSTDPTNSYWPADSDIPNWITDDSFVFNDLSDFNSIPAGNKGLSNYYYEMTKHLSSSERFKLYAGYLFVKIDPTGATQEWSSLASTVYDSLESKYNNLDSILSQYDSRTGPPNFSFDQSLNPQPDNKIDYMILNYRFSSQWSGAELPVSGMDTWVGSGGGFASISYHDFGNYSTSGGFTNCCGISPSVKLFTHEIGHKLYNAPHYGFENGVLGSYLLSNCFGGMMPDDGNEVFACANAWERWFLGWINIKYDLTDVSDNGDYILGDYMTTGDAIRIKIPYVSDQYIWLENHQGNNIFDNRLGYVNSICGYSLPGSPTGLIVYAENISGSKSNYASIKTTGANGIKLFSKLGNYDFSVDKYENRAEWCNNSLADFTQGASNPYSGYSTASSFLSDKDNNGTIAYTDYYNNGPGEQDLFLWVNDNFIYGNFASNVGFQLNDKIGIGTNPAITNFQVYNSIAKELSPIYLNGISIQVIGSSGGNLTVRVKYDDFNFNDDIRICGDIIIPPDTVKVNSGVNIEVDKSGSPNRTTLRAGAFVNPSIITTSPSTYLKLFDSASMTLENESVLILSTNSTLEINNDARLIVKSGTTFHAKSGSNIILKGTGRIIIESGGYLCIENGTNITLQDNFSVIRLLPGYISGVNTNVISDPGTCMTYPQNASFSGNGSIVTFVQDVYVQNETISSDRYIAGRNIYVGYDVTGTPPYGNVYINNNASVIFDADQDVVLDSGIEITTGSTIEVLDED